MGHALGENVFLLDLTTTDGPRELGPRSITFRAPAWSPDGGKMAYVDRLLQGGNALFVADSDGKNSQTIADAGERTAFLWSPTRDRIALGDTDDPSDPYFKALKVVELESGATRTLTNESALSFFWSPDGERIAYVAHDPLARRLSWKVASPEQGRPRKLVDFLPSDELFTMLIFFDQYAYSNSLWSPDSSHLVFTGQVLPVGAGRNGASSGSHVYVMDVDNSSALRVIAKGSLAFWSWN